MVCNSCAHAHVKGVWQARSCEGAVCPYRGRGEVRFKVKDAAWRLLDGAQPGCPDSWGYLPVPVQIACNGWLR